MNGSIKYIYPDSCHAMDGDGSHRIINMNEIKEKNGEDRNKTSNKSNDVRLPWVDHSTGR